jgi:uncharacterized protein (TIGR02300 family)
VKHDFFCRLSDGSSQGKLFKDCHVAKPELGTKRLCASCGAKFYDLNKDPIICPKCEAVFVVPVVTTRASRADAARAPVKTVAVEPETVDADFVSLEDADAEAAGGKKAAAVGDVDVEDEAGDDAADDDTFIEETDDADDDVTDIIGDAGDKEEET